MAGVRQFDEQKVFVKVLQHFAHFGSNGTSLKQLADDAGVQRGSLYNAYGSRQGLLERAYASELAVLSRKIDDLLSPSSVVDAVTDLLTYLAARGSHHHLFSQQISNCLMAMTGATAGSKRFELAIDLVRGKVTRRIDIAIAEGVLRLPEPRYVSLLMILIQGVLAEHRALSDEQVDGSQVTQLLTGIF